MSSAWASSLPAELLARATRIFAAEAQDGFRDRVVIGGLAAFASNLGATPVAQLLADYATLSPAEREKRLRQAQSLLDGTPPPPAPPPPTPVAQAPPAPAQGRPSAPPSGVSLSTRIESLKGVGPVRARLYSRLGIFTVEDLLFHFPARHEAYPPVAPIEDLFFQAEGSVVGRLERLEVENLPRGLKKLRATERSTCVSPKPGMSFRPSVPCLVVEGVENAARFNAFPPGAPC